MHKLWPKPNKLAPFIKQCMGRSNQMDSAAYFDKAVSYKRKIFMKSFPE